MKVVYEKREDNGLRKNNMIITQHYESASVF